MTKRENKYRAWDKEGKRMITHIQPSIPLIVTNFGVMRLNPAMEQHNYIFVEPADRFELMEYINLKDKHEVEIYEDDIVHCWGDYKDGEWGFDRIIKVELTSFKLATLEDCEYKEILGNVFENPELLEMVLKK